MGDTGLVRVLVTVGVATSAGPGPGVRELPAGEAQGIVARRFGRILGPDEDPAGSTATRRGVSN